MKNIKHLKNLLFLCCIIIIGCEHKDPIIFARPELTEIRKDTMEGLRYNTKVQRCIVANAPKTKGEIGVFVNKYLDSYELNAEDKEYEEIHLDFYRETRFTPRDYTESNKGYFDHDRIDYHARDLIVNVVIYPQKGTHELRFFSPDELP
jgi:hypothetical protein